MQSWRRERKLVAHGYPCGAVPHDAGAKRAATPLASWFSLVAKCERETRARAPRAPRRRDAACRWLPRRSEGRPRQSQTSQTSSLYFTDRQKHTATPVFSTALQPGLFFSRGGRARAFRKLPEAMTRAGKKVWVRDPALANDTVFAKGLVISEDATQVRAFSFSERNKKPDGSTRHPSR